MSVVRMDVDPSVAVKMSVTHIIYLCYCELPTFGGTQCYLNLPYLNIPYLTLPYLTLHNATTTSHALLPSEISLSLVLILPNICHPSSVIYSSSISPFGALFIEIRQLMSLMSATNAVFLVYV